MSDYQWVDINEIITEYLPISRIYHIVFGAQEDWQSDLCGAGEAGSIAVRPQPFQLSSATVRR